MTLFGVEEVLPPGNEVSPSGAALREQVNEALAVLSAAVGEDPQTLQARILKLVNHPGPGGCDDHDLREVLRELRVCTQEGAGVYRKRLKRVTQVDRPQGIVRLPRPRSVKGAAAAGACSLCGDRYATGDLTGRTSFTQAVP
ncbi:hypothetical protein [Streptomyces sp. LN704]|uniref:hypothetical protein n=1 Tax=Streptomyces sp. LN704 TaxID=3112982 RepID=UPI0037240257